MVRMGTSVQESGEVGANGYENVDEVNELQILTENEVDTFVMTPCRHRYHK